MGLRLFPQENRSAASDLAKATMAAAFLSLLAVGWTFTALPQQETERLVREPVESLHEHRGAHADDGLMTDVPKRTHGIFRTRPQRQSTPSC